MYEIERIAAIIQPTSKMLEWLNQQPGQTEVLSLQDIRSDCTVLLIPVFDNPEEAQQYIDDMYIEIFENELAAWGINEHNWPKNRSLGLFQAWFEIEFHSMVYDSSELAEEIEPEDDEDEEELEPQSSSMQ